MLRKIQGSIIKVQLRDSRKIQGKLPDIDPFANVYLAEAQQDEEGELSQNLGTIIIRRSSINQVQV